MKLLTGFQPKALLPAKCLERPISPKERLLGVIQLLEFHGELTDKNARLLEAIALSPLWDEYAYAKFTALGLELAKEQFNLRTMNWNYEEALASPENPDNWK